LSEYQIPDLGKATAVAIRFTFGAAAAKLFPQVIMNLAARPAGAGITNGTPEIILLSEPQYSLSGDTNLSPIREGFIVIQIDGCPESFLGQLQIVGDKLPRPENSFFLKVITNTKITEHLKECKVFAIAHRIYIGGSKAFLTRS
jgi:hypothetical protein